MGGPSAWYVSFYKPLDQFLIFLIVSVRERMSETGEGEGSKIDILKSVFSSGADTNGDTTVAPSSPTTGKSVKRNSTFKIVPKRESMILPDVGHERGWIRKAGEKEDLAAEGEGWKSSA